MSDLIDRQAAIDALGERPISWTDSEYELGKQNQYDEDMLALIDVPTIDAEPVRHGHWIERYGVHDGTYYKCSVCNYNCSRTKENYCSDCGAKMEEVDNE